MFVLILQNWCIRRHKFKIKPFSQIFTTFALDFYTLLTHKTKSKTSTQRQNIIE